MQQDQSVIIVCNRTTGRCQGNLACLYCHRDFRIKRKEGVNLASKIGRGRSPVWKFLLGFVLIVCTAIGLAFIVFVVWVLWDTNGNLDEALDKLLSQGSEVVELEMVPEGED